jgi:hypothetical protein
LYTTIIICTLIFHPLLENGIFNYLYTYSYVKESLSSLLRKPPGEHSPSNVLAASPETKEPPLGRLVFAHAGLSAFSPQRKFLVLSVRRHVV